jgi:hypothetical protein
MGRDGDYQNVSEGIRFGARTVVRSIPEILNFWLIPGSVLRHVARGRADNDSTLTYIMAGVIEAGKLGGYYELGKEIIGRL